METAENVKFEQLVEVGPVDRDKKRKEGRKGWHA